MNEREVLQHRAAELFLAGNHRGYLDYSVGLGKCKIAIEIIDVLSTLLNKSNFLIGVPNRNLIEEWILEFNKWNKNELLKYVTFTTHKSAYLYLNESIDLYISDECHKEITEIYSRNLDFEYYLGLSGSLNKKKKGVLESKGIACIDTITQLEATDRGIVNEVSLIKVEYELSDSLYERKYLKTKYKTSDKRRYKYYDDLFAKLKTELYSLGYTSLGSNVYEYIKSDYLKKTKPDDFKLLSSYANVVTQRRKLLLTSNTSILLSKMILHRIKEGTFLDDIKSSRAIVFSEDIATIDKICDYSVHSKKLKNKKDNSELNNKTILDFNQKEFDVLGASKMINMGTNFTDLSIAIYQSFTSSHEDYIQRGGRLTRLDKDDCGFNIYLVAKGTVMESWFNNISQGKEVRIITLNAE